MIAFNRASLRAGSAAAALLALAGCAVVPPSGPRVMAMPGSGKTYEQFTGEDATCRQAAAYQAGPGPSQQDTTNTVVGSAVVGTALGAVAGAALGSAGGAVGGGAAVGAGLGLLAGTAVGSNNAQASSSDLQYRYDTAYTQCMVAHGNTVQAPPQPVVYGYPYGPDPYGPYPVFIHGYYYHPHYYRY